MSRIDRDGLDPLPQPDPGPVSGPIDWARLLDDTTFMAEYHDVLASFDHYMANGSGPLVPAPATASALDGPIAYFCAEYGFHESLGIYSGGLGVLAGDHMKTASDMALPFIGVGLLYRKRLLPPDDRRRRPPGARLPRLRPDAPAAQPRPGRRRRAAPRSTVELPGRDLPVAVWLAQVGRVPVLLLDTDIPENDDADRPITHILYVRGREMRLHQELVLGVGGVRALRALGHRARRSGTSTRATRRSCSPSGPASTSRPATTLDEALATGPRATASSRSTRPVSAGNERFDADLVRRVAGPLLDGDGRPTTGGVPVDRVLELGRRRRRRRRASST